MTATSTANAATLSFVSIGINSRTRTETAITSDAAQFGASGYASADVTAVYKNASVTATKTATLGYAKVNGSWGRHRHRAERPPLIRGDGRHRPESHA